MSGGRFDYLQFRILEIAGEIEEEVKNNHIEPVHDWYGARHFSDETIEEFNTAIDILRKAHVYVQRIDWLLSGDDGEETFHERLKEDLDELNNNSKLNK